MSSLYYNYLYPETKALLKYQDEKDYIDILSKVIKFSIGYSKDLLSKLKQDMIVLLGCSNGGFGIATTHSTSVTAHNHCVTISSNVAGYGEDTLTFGPIPNNQKTARFNFNISKSAHNKQVMKYIDYTELKRKLDSNYLRCSKFYKKAFYSSSKNCIATSDNPKKKSKHLFYFFNDENAKATENRKTNYFPTSFINSHDLIHLFKKEVLKINTKLNPDIVTNLDTHSLIKYLSNPLWRDLNIPLPPQFVNSHLPVPYHRLKYSYTKYGTKALRTTFFGTSCKALQKLLATSPQLLLFYHTLNKAINFSTTVDVNIQLRFLTVSGNALRFTTNTDRFAKGFLYLLRNGISINRVINTLETNERDYYIIQDISNYSDLCTSFEQAGINVKDSITDIHDKLAMAYNRAKDLAYYGREIPLTALEEEMFFETEDYIFKPVSITDNLDILGTKLKICVRSYDRQAIAKECTIVGVYNKTDGSPFACIEINRHGAIVQVKYERNRRGLTNPEFQSLVFKWANIHKLTTKGCYDLDNEDPIPF